MRYSPVTVAQVKAGSQGSGQNYYSATAHIAEGVALVHCQTRVCSSGAGVLTLFDISTSNLAHEERVLIQDVEDTNPEGLQERWRMLTIQKLS